MQTDQVTQKLPNWLPDSVARYVAHTERGVSIRELARQDGCHASTVLRQIRKLEAMRDDPLVDDALNRFRQEHRDEEEGTPLLAGDEAWEMPEEAVLRQEGARVLRRLCEAGAVLAVAGDLDKAVVMRDETTRTAVVSRQIAQAMALKGWITCAHGGRVSRYIATPSGRAALSQLVAEAENTAQGFSEAQAGFDTPCRVAGTRKLPVSQELQKGRFCASESPLVALARRRDKNGHRFLGEDLVAAGERLREDFELAQMGPADSPNWARFLKEAGRRPYLPDDDVGTAQELARKRIVQAMAELGAGLGDVALRCCCFLEGLELAEKELGWSARSGKVVLRIALGRLRDHYQANAGGSGDYIG